MREKEEKAECQKGDDGGGDAAKVGQIDADGNRGEEEYESGV
jgi:hypothetical protein